MYMVGILSTLFALAGLEVLSVCFKSMGMRNMMVEFLTRSEESLKQVTEIFRSKDYIIVSYEMKEYPTPDQGMVYQVSMVQKTSRHSILLQKVLPSCSSSQNALMARTRFLQQRILTSQHHTSTTTRLPLVIWLS
jgi:hypothetical protein